MEPSSPCQDVVTEICASRVNLTAKEFTEVKVYKRRWLVLFVFSLNTMMNACMFITFGSINNILCKYYDVSPRAIDWTANIFLLVYIIIGLPSAYVMSNFGLRPLLLAGSSLQAASAALHYAGSSRSGFGLVMAGQVSAALAVGTILQVPARLAVVWFGKQERATATSIAVALNIFGVAVGFLLPTSMVHDSHRMEDIEEDLTYLYVTQLATCGVFLVLTYMFFEEAPPTPPSVSQALTSSKLDHVTPDFVRSLKMLSIDRNFLLIAQSYGIYYGLLCCLQVSLNEMITAVFGNGFSSWIGWMGFGCQLTGMISTAALGVLLDRYRFFHAAAIGLNFGCVLLSAALVVVLTQTKFFNAVLVLYVAIGCFALPFFSSGFDHVAQMTFPVPEGTSGAVILIVGSVYGFAFVYGFDLLISYGHLQLAGYLLSGLYFCAMILAASASTKLKRHEAERVFEKESDSLLTNVP